MSKTRAYSITQQAVANEAERAGGDYDRVDVSRVIALDELELRPGDVPVGRDASAEQSAVAVEVVPREGDLGALRIGEPSVQLPGQGLWRVGHGRQAPDGPTQRGSCDSAAAQALDMVRSTTRFSYSPSIPEAEGWLQNSA